MTDLLLVEWLPRGGIAQTTAAWRDVARSAGLDVTVVGRAGSEVQADISIDRRLPGKPGALEAHLRTVRGAVAAVRQLRPSVVYVQHTWIPRLERAVLDAAAEVGARSVLAVHNARPHERRAGTTMGLDRLLDRADDLVAHSRHVAAQLGGRPVTVVGLPELTPVTRALPAVVPGLEPDGRRRAVAFGVLRRGYKGADGLAEVAAELGPGWDVVAAGAGAPSLQGVRTHPGYLTTGQLRWLVESADVVLLPYREASQSGAVSVAQSLGTPPVVSAVGGIPEQVLDGRTGILVPLGADPSTWADATVRAADEVDRVALAATSSDAAARAGAAWLDVVDAGRGVSRSPRPS